MNQPRQSLLLVDDDPEIRQLLGDFLGVEGFDIETAGDAVEMDKVLSRLRPDLIILDLMMPGEDGISICRRLAKPGAPPIIMLTAKSDDIDQVLGLEMGADDYVVKPFAPRTLLARIRSVLRRASTTPIVSASQRLSFDRFVIDIDARQVFVAGGAQIDLTSGEFDLLALLVRRARRVQSRDQILDALRGRNADPFDRTVDMLVSRLRRKLADASPGSEIISTVRNNGYLLTATVAPIS